MTEDRDSAPPVASPPQAAPSARRAAEAGLGLYARAVVARLALFAAGLLALAVADRWSLPQMRLAVAADGMGVAVATVVMMVGLNRFARAEEDSRVGGLAIGSVLLLLLELVCGLYATKLRLDMATESADIVLVARAIHSLPLVQTAAHALALLSALVLLSALRKVAARLGDARLAKRAGQVFGLLAAVTAGAVLAPLATGGHDGNGTFAYEVILVGAATFAAASYVSVVFSVRRAMSRP